MPTPYVPKTNALAPSRVQKIAKKLIDEAGEDRNLALEAHKYFRNMVNENPADSTAKSLMVETLKLAQASKNNVIKILQLVVKMQDVLEGDSNTKLSSKGKDSSVFSELENLLND